MFHRITVQWLLLWSALLLSVPALAQPTSDNTSNESEFTWQVDVGIALSYRAGIVDSLKNEEGRMSVAFLLAGGLYYDDFFIESSPTSQHPLTLGYTLASSNDYRVNLVAESWFSDISAKDAIDDSLDGIAMRRGSIEVGIEYQRSYTLYDLRTRILHDALSRHGGSIATMELARPIFTHSTLIIPSVGLTYISADAVDYYYGIDSFEATAERPEYKPKSAYVGTLRLYVERPISASLSLVGYGGYALFSNAIADSPIVTPRSDAYTLGLGVLWTF